MTSANAEFVASATPEAAVLPPKDSGKNPNSNEPIISVCGDVSFQTTKALDFPLLGGSPNDISYPLLSVSSAKEYEFDSVAMHRTVFEDRRKKRRHVTFGLVDLYHFDRLQGFACVPSQGGSTLGMASEHWSEERVPVFEHQSRRKYQRYSALLRFCLEGKLLLSFQQFQMLESRVKCQQRLLTRKNEAKQWGSTSRDIDDEYLRRPVESIENPSDEDLSFLDSLEEYYFLQPLSVKRRRILLRKAGLQKIDPVEKHECEAIRKSRSECGCTCVTGICDPRSCECALNGIPCQVDRARFPCVCLSPNHCSNPEGRIEFNPIRVRTHYLHTRMRLESEEREAAYTTESPIPAKRSRFLEIAIPPNWKNVCTDQFPVEGAEGGQTLPSPTSLQSGISRSVEEALNATASNGGCRDCQNDRYMHLLVQELQCQQKLQNSFEIEEEEDEREGNEESVYSEDRFIQSSTQMNNTVQELNAALLNTVSCDEVVGDDEDNDDDEDDVEGDGEDCECAGLPDECSNSESGRVAHRPPLVETLTSSMSGVNLPKETALTQSFCRLDPIASLFHGPHEISSTCPEVEEDEEPSASSISPRRPPSVCEVVIA